MHEKAQGDLEAEEGQECCKNQQHVLLQKLREEPELSVHSLRSRCSNKRA